MPAPERTAIAFVGFMGAGKSTTAGATAAALDRELVDVDAAIVTESGISIPALFSREGEEGFRARERRHTLAALDRGAVVALGGGAVESVEIREALAGHVCVWCRVDENLAWSRCAGSDRPLARNRDAFVRRMRAREPLYREVGRVVMPTAGAGIGASAAPWLDALRNRPEVRMAWAVTDSARYPALIGPGAGALLGEVAPEARPGARSFGVIDRAAAAALPDLLAAIAGGEGATEPIEVDGGEAEKTLAASERVLRELAARGVLRDDALLAFGGGVVGDLAGFCAAVYLRGIAVVQVPTTLVAQVDSAYGGKTGVDLPEAKNYVGAFHQPAAVLADPAALRTLPGPELAAGFAEVVKTALLAGGDLWEAVRSLEEIDADSVAPLIFDCALTKLDVVAADERDGGVRATLNLGHTVGHAIEAASSYARYRHGEAVALGTLAALRLSGAGDLREEVGELFARAGLPTRLDEAVELDAVLAATGRDKKRSAAGLGFVLLERPGVAAHSQSVGADSLREAVEELYR